MIQLSVKQGETTGATDTFFALLIKCRASRVVITTYPTIINSIQSLTLLIMETTSLLENFDSPNMCKLNAPM